MKTETVKFPGKRKEYIKLGMYMLVVVFSMVSCRQMLDSPPVVVSQPVCLLSSEHDTFQFAGISFECCNIGSKTVSSMEVSFLVFISEDGGNPFFGSNVVTSDVSMNLASGVSGLFEISLDSGLAFIPSEPFFIDCFYVRKVHFSDGSEWADPLGIYYAGSMLS
ncbi:MAG: hypothetical protein KBT02_11155 [Treponema sp.]|nr:hypothetical protein [Candidatus Treponema caballi]